MTWQPAESEGQLLSFQEVLVLDARYWGLVQSAFFDKVEMTVVLLGMDIQPFIFLSQVDTEVVKERDSGDHSWACPDRSDKNREPTRCTKLRGCHYPHRQDRLASLGERLSDAVS